MIFTKRKTNAQGLEENVRAQCSDLFNTFIHKQDTLSQIGEIKFTGDHINIE